MKNDYTPSENGGLAWLADKGAREAQFDGQGSLVALPEKATPADKYERLLEALYHAAYCARENTREGCFVTLGDFIEALENFLEPESDAAAHYIDEGIRDAAKSTAKREEGEGEMLVGIEHDGSFTIYPSRVPPLTDHTTEPFTEKETAIVREHKRNHPHMSYAEVARTWKKTAPSIRIGDGREYLERLASIADHLARTEG